jgi:hypothetical protein
VGPAHALSASKTHGGGVKEVLVGLVVLAPLFALGWWAMDVVIVLAMLAVILGSAWLTGTLILAFWPWRRDE